MQPPKNPKNLEQGEKLVPQIEDILKDIERRNSTSVPADPDAVIEAYAAQDVLKGIATPDETGRDPADLKPSVPEHIAKTAKGIESFGEQWADQIETAAKKQIEADTKRYEESMALANRIRKDAIAEAQHVSNWAIKTRNAGLEIKDVFARLNGHDTTETQAK
jgi:hypothetical protein